MSREKTAKRAAFKTHIQTGAGYTLPARIGDFRPAEIGCFLPAQNGDFLPALTIGKKGPWLEEQCGYYGERLVLKAQQLGLNTCWVAMTYNKIKTAFVVDSGEKLCIVIALGYGENQGVPHKSKSAKDVMKADGQVPKWFRDGVEAALLAPTAMNQQKFVFSLDGNQVSAKPGLGFYSQIDLGIVKYHFEIGAGTQNFIWA